MPEDGASEPELVQVEDGEAGTQDESPESFLLSEPNERLGQSDQSDAETASSGDSVVLSPRKEPRRRFTRKEKGKKKMPEFETGNDEFSYRVWDLFDKKVFQSRDIIFMEDKTLGD